MELEIAALNARLSPNIEVWWIGADGSVNFGIGGGPARLWGRIHKYASTTYAYVPHRADGGGYRTSTYFGSAPRDTVEFHEQRLDKQFLGHLP